MKPAKKFIPGFLFAIALLLHGCGGGGASSSSTPVGSTITSSAGTSSSARSSEVNSSEVFVAHHAQVFTHHRVDRARINQNLLAQQQENIFQRQFARTQRLAWNLAGEVKGALDVQAPIVTAFPASRVGSGLKMVAKMIFSARCVRG